MIANGATALPAAALFDLSAGGPSWTMIEFRIGLPEASQGQGDRVGFVVADDVAKWLKCGTGSRPCSHRQVPRSQSPEPFTVFVPPSLI